MFEVPLSRDKIAIVYIYLYFLKNGYKNFNDSCATNADMLPKAGRFDYQNL